MPITVRDMLEEPTFRARLVAGEAGLDHVVTWAATCEMGNPWEWLDPGDLLLVNGHRIPAAPQAQTEFISRLGSAGMSALGVAEEAFAPHLTDVMLAAADDIGFPVLRIGYEVAFVAIAKYVAGATGPHDQRNLRLISRIYDRARHSSASGRPFQQSLNDLGDLVGARLCVTTPLGYPLLDTSTPCQELQDALAQEATRRHGHRLPAAIRLKVGMPGTIAMPVPSGRPALLVVEPHGATCDGVVLTHIGVLVALELEREGTRQALLAGVATDVMLGLVRRLLDTSVAAQTIRQLGIEPEAELRIAALHPANDVDLVQTLIDHRIPHLTCQDQARLLVMLNDDPPARSVLRDVARTRAVGLSAPFVGLTRVPDAASEAAFALASSPVTGLAVYGDDAQPLQPRSLAEAQRLVDEVLGPLLALHRAGHGEWLTTLRVFLSCNRSWKRCSEQLHLHKQSLVYRIKRIEALLDRSLDDTEHLAEIWFALKALDSLTTLPSDDGSTDDRSSGRSRGVTPGACLSG